MERDEALRKKFEDKWHNILLPIINEALGYEQKSVVPFSRLNSRLDECFSPAIGKNIRDLYISLYNPTVKEYENLIETITLLMDKQKNNQ